MSMISVYVRPKRLPGLEWLMEDDDREIKGSRTQDTKTTRSNTSCSGNGSKDLQNAVRSPILSTKIEELGEDINQTAGGSLKKLGWIYQT